jgi:hypothetical protein
VPISPITDERTVRIGRGPESISGKRSEAAGLGRDGTLPAAIDDIFDQTGAMIVLIRVPDWFGEEEEWPSLTEEGG